jgi:UDP-4-amino-4,6-dideoxy-N-acetyl-beta-L-altrosamine N-acetyltransferase
MILSGYGIRLIRLHERHLELVREHRNSARIQQFMEFREYISPEMQLDWFQKINTHQHGYYLIEVAGKLIGMINGSEIDWEKRETGNGGIFIWEESFWKTAEPLHASILLTDISLFLGLERTFVRILSDNKQAIAFNRQLGYEVLPHQAEIKNQRYVLQKEQYLKKMGRIRDFLQKKFPDPVTCYLENNESEVEKWIANYYQASPYVDRENLRLVYP